MKKASKLALAALALSLVPFELKAGKDEEFSYQSLLIGFSGSKNEDGKRDLTISLFNMPKFLKKKKTQEEQAEEIPEADLAEPAEEAGDTSPDAEEIPEEPSL